MRRLPVRRGVTLNRACENKEQENQTKYVSQVLPSNKKTTASFRRQTFHVPNLRQMRSNKELRSLTLGSAHEKFGNQAYDI